MHLALIDIGNTRGKFVRAEGAQILERRQLPTNEITPESLRRLCEDWFPQLDGAVLCSVVPAVNGVFSTVFGERLLTLTDETALGIGIDYPEPATIGPDRLANALALAEIDGAPGIVIDFGTAVTFDVVSVHGNYVGGVIAPGLEMMNDYMSERTALLPRVDLIKSPPPIGRTTEAAMQAGAYYGYAGMVRNILNQVLATCTRPSDVTIVATGGNAELFADELPLSRIDPDLTLHGLRLIAEANRFHFLSNTARHE